MGLIVDPISPNEPRPLIFTSRGEVVHEPPMPGEPAWEQREYARKVAAVTSLAGFIRYMWPVLQPGRALIWGWHLDIVCWSLEQLSYGNIEGNELVICIPPRHLKSITVAEAFPAWLWLYAPWVQTLGVSAAEKIAVRDTKAMRRLVQHPRYQELASFAREFLGPFHSGDSWTIASDQNQKMRFENTAGGYRIGLAAGAQITGDGADLFIVDDPIDAKAATEGGHEVIMANMAKVIERWGGVWHSRLNDPKRSIRVVIMQRLHEADLAGWLLSTGTPGVVLPTEYNPAHPNVCEFDWREEEGELLFPERLGDAEIKRMRRPGGWSKEAYAAQHDQLPSPSGGGFFTEDSWRFISNPAPEIAAHARKRGRLIASYDCANKEGKRNSFSVCHVMAKFFLSPKVYVLDEYRGKWELPGLVKTFDRVEEEWRPHVHVIEDAQNGTALLQLKSKSARCHSVSPQLFGGKTTRAGYTQRRLEDGTLEIPPPGSRPWVRGLIKEHANFPSGRYKDRVDSIAQGCLYFDVIEQRAGGSASKGLQWIADLGRAGFRLPEGKW